MNPVRRFWNAYRESFRKVRAERKEKVIVIPSLSETLRERVRTFDRRSRLFKRSSKSYLQDPTPEYLQGKDGD
jgi:hypothetical protein